MFKNIIVIYSKWSLKINLLTNVFIKRSVLIFGRAQPFFSVFRCGIVVKDLLVMGLNDAAHVRHATVANFHVVLVEDGVEIVV